MFIKHKSFKWKKVPYDDASERFGFDTLGVDGIDGLFGEEPDHCLVHKGDITVDGPAIFGAHDRDEVTMHIVDGNLTVKGPLLFNQSDQNGALFVTGNVTCDNAFVVWDAQLFVGKSLKVRSLLTTYLTETGHFIVKGGLEAEAWLEAGDRGAMELGKPPKARLLRCGESQYRAFSPPGAARPKVALDEDGEAEEEEEDDDDEAPRAEAPAAAAAVEKPAFFTFTPREAEFVEGILAAELLDPEDDVNLEAIEDAMVDGRPMFRG